MQQLGRYEILAELGHGAMGTVYRARDPKIDRVVALKTVRVIGATPEQEAEYRRRFFREAQAAGKLSHPGIVTIYDVGEDEATQTPYIVMEYIEGRTLESLLSDPAAGAPALTPSLELIQQVAEALDYAHAQGIVHRDVKPANIMVTAGGRAKIADFGIAKLAQSEFTVPGQILGTPAYLAPEQLKGGTTDGRSDLFSLGVILYWMLTGQKPFTGDTSTVLYQVACQEPAPVTEVNHELPGELNGVVSRALAKDPALRYQRGKELAEDLEDLQEGRVPRWASGGQAGPAIEKTMVERPPAAVEKTVVERPPVGPETPPTSGAGLAPPGRSAYQSVAQFIRGLSLKVRIAMAAGIALLLFLPFFFRQGATLPIPALVKPPPKFATLQIRSSHSFRAADISVWVDDKLAHEGKLAGVVRKSWFRTTVYGNFSATLRVPVGSRVVRVRVHSPGEGYDQTREVKEDFVENDERTLVLGFTPKGRNLRLSWNE